MTQKGKLMYAFILAALVLFTILIYLPYRRDIQIAYSRLDSIERQIVETKCGSIEVAIRGEGEPVLVSHGIGGGFDQGLGLVEAYLGDGYKVIAPSRFGYHATPLPADATPASQSDAFVCLLDAFQIKPHGSFFLFIFAPDQREMKKLWDNQTK